MGADCGVVGVVSVHVKAVTVGILTAVVGAPLAAFGVVACGGFLSLSDDDEVSNPPSAPSTDGDVTLSPIEAGDGVNGDGGEGGNAADDSGGITPPDTNGPIWMCGRTESPTFSNPTECAADRAMRSCVQGVSKIPSGKCAPGGGNGTAQMYCEDCVDVGGLPSYAYASCLCKKP